MLRIAWGSPNTDFPFFYDKLKCSVSYSVICDSDNGWSLRCSPSLTFHSLYFHGTATSYWKNTIVTENNVYFTTTDLQQLFALMQFFWNFSNSNFFIHGNQESLPDIHISQDISICSQYKWLKQVSNVNLFHGHSNWFVNTNRCLEENSVSHFWRQEEKTHGCGISIKTVHYWILEKIEKNLYFKNIHYVTAHRWPYEIVQLLHTEVCRKGDYELKYLIEIRMK